MSNELNDPNKWVMRGQTAIKHKILDNYLRAYATILHRGNSTGRRTSLNYIDGFSGRGVYRDGERGSPIIAMGVADMIHNDTAGQASLKIHAIELDDENFSSLTQEVQKAKADHPAAVVDLRQGSFTDNIWSIMDSLGEYEYAFVFIDPFGYKDAIELETVVRLISRDRTEVFITFMSHNINRYLGDKTRTKDATMARIFGNDRLKQIQGLKDRQEMLAKLYGEEVQRQADELGKLGTLVYSTSVKYDDKDQNIYHLIHLSRDPKARLEMEKAVKRTDILMEPLPLLLAMEQANIEQIVIDYLTKKPGKRAPARSVAGAMWRTYWELTWLGEVRQVLLDMERIDKISITRAGSKPRKVGQAIDEKDMIQLKV